MSDEHKHSHGGGAAGATGGVLWFAGWLFTIGFVNLAWWKVILGPGGVAVPPGRVAEVGQPTSVGPALADRRN